MFSSLCDLYKARESNNESLQIQALKEVKNAISQEAIRFSGHQQHVRLYKLLLFFDYFFTL